MSWAHLQFLQIHGRGRAPRGPEKRRARHRAIAPATDGHPPAFGVLNDNSTAIQPLLNSAPTVGNFNPSTTVLQPPHQPSFNRLPTTTHTLIARASSHLPRQARTSSSLPQRVDLRQPQPQPNLNHPSTIRTSPELVSAFGT